MIETNSATDHQQPDLLFLELHGWLYRKNQQSLRVDFLIVVGGGGGSLHVVIIWFPRCIVIYCLIFAYIVSWWSTRLYYSLSGMADGLTSHPNRPSCIHFSIHRLVTNLRLCVTWGVNWIKCLSFEYWYYKNLIKYLFHISGKIFVHENYYFLVKIIQKNIQSLRLCKPLTWRKVNRYAYH